MLFTCEQSSSSACCSVTRVFDDDGARRWPFAQILSSPSMLFSMFSTRLVPRLLAGAPLLRKAAIPLATRRVVVASPFSTSLLVHQAAKAATAVKKPSTSKKAAATPARKTKAAAPAKKSGKKKAVVKPAPKKRAAKKVKVRARTTKKKAAPKKRMSQ